jgi:lysophospholipase L1-like esterase
MSHPSKRSERATGRAPRGRRWIFAVLPALCLLALGEGAVRLAVLAEPTLRSLPLGPETAGLFRQDEDLFWSLAPDLDLPFLGHRVVTNSLGLRSPPIEPKQPGEYRILSLGESSTFGSGVAGEQTYTAGLVAELAARGAGGRVVAINAGVPAYTSFQSLQYLELRGLALEPDLLLVYHEVNDYLPSSVRDSSQNEIGVFQTDWQRWRAQRAGGLAWIGRHSELVRFLRLRVARARIDRFDPGDFENPVTEIGLPRIGIAPRLMRVDGAEQKSVGIKEQALATRVSSEERREILAAFAQLASEHEIDLLLIHPAYRDSSPHHCILTEFAAQSGIAIFEAGLALHPEGLPRGALFRDSWHPNAEGHARLARLVAGEIRRRFR